ncbi:MAG TPA: hypothetical protein VME45_03095 [Stellaceae bacterium]|nr:hypothetical protein [Stellaceae bacterium]
MDDDAERLRRRTELYRRPLRNLDAVRTAQYLLQVQHDTASMASIFEEPQNLENLGPAYLRSGRRITANWRRSSATRNGRNCLPTWRHRSNGRRSSRSEAQSRQSGDGPLVS